MNWYYSDEQLADHIIRAIRHLPIKSWSRQIGSRFQADVMMEDTIYLVELWEVDSSPADPLTPGQSIPYIPLPFIGYPIRLAINGVGSQDHRSLWLRFLYKRLKKYVK